MHNKPYVTTKEHISRILIFAILAHAAFKSEEYYFAFVLASVGLVFCAKYFTWRLSGGRMAKHLYYEDGKIPKHFQYSDVLALMKKARAEGREIALKEVDRIIEKRLQKLIPLPPPIKQRMR